MTAKEHDPAPLVAGHPERLRKKRRLGRTVLGAVGAAAVAVLGAAVRRIVRARS